MDALEFRLEFAAGECRLDFVRAAGTISGQSWVSLTANQCYSAQRSNFLLCQISHPCALRSFCSLQESLCFSSPWTQSDGLEQRGSPAELNWCLGSILGTKMTKPARIPLPCRQRASLPQSQHPQYCLILIISHYST